MDDASTRQTNGLCNSNWKTGKLIEKFVELTAKELQWGSILWEGEGLDEIGRREDTNEVVIRVDKGISVLLR